MIKAAQRACRSLSPAPHAVPVDPGRYLLRLCSIRLLLVAGAVLLLLWLPGCAGRIESPPKKVAADYQPELGVEVVAMQRTAAGNMLDFRFRVVDPEKAMPLFREDIFPYLIDQKYNIPLKVTDTTKVGPMRPTSRDPRTGKVYFMFFRNPNRYVQSGQLVTLVVGEQRIENLVVR